MQQNDYSSFLGLVHGLYWFTLTENLTGSSNLLQSNFLAVKVLTPLRDSSLLRFFRRKIKFSHHKGFLSSYVKTLTKKPRMGKKTIIIIKKEYRKENMPEHTTYI